MESKFDGFIGVMKDNDLQYFTLLKASISSVDPYSSLYVVRTPSHYNFRVSTSSNSLINLMVEEINLLHKMLKLRLTYSKSIKSSSNISFSLEYI